MLSKGCRRGFWVVRQILYPFSHVWFLILTTQFWKSGTDGLKDWMERSKWLKHDTEGGEMGFIHIDVDVRTYSIVCCSYYCKWNIRDILVSNFFKDNLENLPILFKLKKADINKFQETFVLHFAYLPNLRSIPYPIVAMLDFRMTLSPKSDGCRWTQRNTSIRCARFGIWPLSSSSSAEHDLNVRPRLPCNNWILHMQLRINSQIWARHH